MEGVYFERKCYYMGFWKDDILADNVIRQLADLVRSGKGTKCKVHLSNDGLKVTTSAPLAGKSIKDIVAFKDIFFVTVNQYHPQCLLFITRDERRRYRIIGIRCASTTDANLFVSCFKDLRSATKMGRIGNNLELRQIDSGNWTLRAKHQNTGDKRQLTTLVDMNSQKMTDHSKLNGAVKHTRTDINSKMNITVEPSTSETKKDIQPNGLDRKNSNTVAIQTGSNEYSEEISYSVSETGLRDELDHLSHELRDIKLILETTAGVGSQENEINTELVQNGDKLDGNDNENKVDIVIVDEVKEPISAEVLDNDSSSDNEEKENGNAIQNGNLNVSKSTESTNSDEGEIKVAVPDYRKLDTQKPSYVRRYIPKENHVNNTNGDGDMNSPRLSTTSYDTWKEDVVLRARSTRPRSAYLSTSSSDSSGQGSVRDRSSHVLYATTSKTHSLPHHSLRVPMRRSVNLSSTVERPIEKVYPRPRSVHGSIVYRPISGNHRAAIYSIPTKRVYLQNQNRVEMNGHRHSGIADHQRKDDAVIIKT